MSTASDRWIVAAQRIAPVDAILQRVHQMLADTCPELVPHILQREPLGLFGLASGFFYYPIALQLELSGGDESGVFELADGLALGHSYFYCLDRILDDGEVDYPMVLAAPIFLQEYLRIMASLLPQHPSPQSTVQEWHAHYYAMYVSAQIYEWTTKRTLPDITISDLNLLHKKSAPVCLPVRVVLEQQNLQERAPQLEDAFLTYSAGLQLVDDLSDVVADFRNGLSSIPLRLMLRQVLGLRVWPESSEVSPDDVRLLAAEPSLRSLILNLAASYFNEASQKAENAGHPTLAHLSQFRYAWSAEQLI
ncbi:hypothetical protein [Sinomonas humi]|uniref:hypothetical protein n=1 Tax=Sinomonas humi TaxID=1338436 RepID=UPI0012E08DDD|nr:hypothetical protein [Sinomonas humi]